MSHELRIDPIACAGHGLCAELAPEWIEVVIRAHVRICHVKISSRKAPKNEFLTSASEVAGYTFRKSSVIAP